MPLRVTPYFELTMVRVGGGGSGKTTGYIVLGSSIDVPQDILTWLNQARQTRTTGRAFYLNENINRIIHEKKIREGQLRKELDKNLIGKSPEEAEILKNDFKVKMNDIAEMTKKASQTVKLVEFIPFTGVLPTAFTNFRDNSGNIREDIKITLNDVLDVTGTAYPIRVQGKDTAGQENEYFDELYNQTLIKNNHINDLVIDSTNKDVLVSEMPRWLNLLPPGGITVATVTKADSSGILNAIRDQDYAKISPYLKFALKDQPINKGTASTKIYAMVMGSNIEGQSGEMYLVYINGKVLEEPVRVNVLGAASCAMLQKFNGNNDKAGRLTKSSQAALDELLNEKALSEEELKELKIL